MEWQQWNFKDSICRIFFAYIQQFDISTHFKAEDDALLFGFNSVLTMVLYKCISYIIQRYTGYHQSCLHFSLAYLSRVQTLEIQKIGKILTGLKSLVSNRYRDVNKVLDAQGCNDQRLFHRGCYLSWGTIKLWILWVQHFSFP